MQFSNKYEAIMMIVNRTSQFSNRFVPIAIIVDGIKIGSVSYGERSEFSLIPGLHTIQAELKISKSNSIEFQLFEGKNIEFELGSNISLGKNILLALLHPAMIFAILILDKIINSDIFLVSAFSLFLVYEVWFYVKRKQKSKLVPEDQKYYIYLKEIS